MRFWREYCLIIVIFSLLDLWLLDFRFYDRTFNQYFYVQILNKVFWFHGKKIWRKNTLPANPIIIILVRRKCLKFRDVNTRVQYCFYKVMRDLRQILHSFRVRGLYMLLYLFLVLFVSITLLSLTLAPLSISFHFLFASLLQIPTLLNLYVHVFINQ